MPEELTLLVFALPHQLGWVEELSRTYGGFVVVTIFVRPGELEQVHHWLERDWHTRFRDHLTVVVFVRREADALYTCLPSNLLLNLARQAARTVYGVYLRPGSLPWGGLLRRWDAHLLALFRSHEEKLWPLALVLPELQYRPDQQSRRGPAQLRPSLPSTKPALAALNRTGDVVAKGQPFLDWPRWWQASEAFTVPHAMGWDPVLIMDLRSAPELDEAHCGFGGDGQQLALALAARSAIFMVDPLGFVVTLPSYGTPDDLPRRFWHARSHAQRLDHVSERESACDSLLVLCCAACTLILVRALSMQVASSFAVPARRAVREQLRQR